MGVYEHDHTLPRLPIPALADTGEELKKRVAPIVDEAVYASFCQCVDAFCAPGGAGEELQARLHSWQAGLPGNTSWLRPFWDDNYTAFRGSLPKGLHYTLQLRRGRWGNEADMLPLFTWALSHCVQELRAESLPPEMAKSYASMDTLRYMFYTRIPLSERDMWFIPQLARPMSAAVCCKGHWFLLGLTDLVGRIHPPPVLAAGFAQIRRQADALPPAPGVAAFTCAPREQAAALRAELSREMLNRLSLESIEKSVFVICLDDAPKTETEYGKSVICGDAANRWFDKSVQVVCSGGQLGVSLEHSGCDGSLWGYMLAQADRILESSLGQDEEYFIPTADGSTGSIAAPHLRLLEWVVAPALAQKLQTVQDEFAAWGKSMLFAQRRMPSIAKSHVKVCNCSPDAFVQMLFTAAYHSCTGRFRSTYEAVSARAFYQGRTEGMRTVTPEAVALVTALEQNAPDEELREKLLLATTAHSEDISRCKQGLGCERHMTGLDAMQRMYHSAAPLPALFESEGFRALKHDALSTSSIVAPCIDYFGFAPVVADGAGLGYGLNADALHVAVSAYAESGLQPELFLDAVEQAGERLLRAFA